ncbi:MAG: hypothetical protein HQ575_02220 [Candidatus Omnitrophica bacterium]|nr:hypothetical protein [Candidatus Omnitrophota bacterium]
MRQRCSECVEYRRCRESFTSWIFFIIGLLATIAIRVVIVLTHVNPLYGKAAWYIGITGFFAFFVYKFRVNKARAKIIETRGLIKKIDGKNKLSDEDYNVLGAILCGLSSRKEALNYLFIFGLSAVALLAALYFDFIK